MYTFLVFEGALWVLTTAPSTVWFNVGVRDVRKEGLENNCGEASHHLLFCGQTSLSYYTVYQECNGQIVYSKHNELNFELWITSRFQNLKNDVGFPTIITFFGL